MGRESRRRAGSLDSMNLTVTPVDPADADTVERAYAVVLASADDLPDLPPPARQWFDAMLRDRRASNRVEAAIAHLNGTPAGVLTVNFPLLDNLNNASVEVRVHPAHRRRGVGRALHAYAVGRLRAEGRTRLIGHSVETMPDGVTRSPAPTAYATAMGAKSALAEVRRRLDLSTVDQAGLDVMLAESWRHGAGYAALTWIDPAPAEYLDDIAYLDGRLVSDAPMGELDWEPEKVDADRVRESEAARVAEGARLYHAGVRHLGSGRIVAWTALSLAVEPDWHAYQQITLVDPGHRGHRLGTIVKIENLRHALRHEPGLRMIDTWNAASNHYMISINEAIGFRAVDVWQNWQQSV